MVSFVDGWQEATRRFKWGRKDRGKRERTAKRRSDAGEEPSDRAAVQKILDNSGEDEWIAANVEMIVSSKGIIWNVEKKRSRLEIVLGDLP